MAGTIFDSGHQGVEAKLDHSGNNRIGNDSTLQPHAIGADSFGSIFNHSSATIGLQCLFEEGTEEKSKRRHSAFTC